MGKILRDMTAGEQAFYDEDSKKFPWLKTITMSDDDFMLVSSVTLAKEKLPFGFMIYGIVTIVG